MLVITSQWKNLERIMVSSLIRHNQACYDQGRTVVIPYVGMARKQDGGSNGCIIKRPRLRFCALPRKLPYEGMRAQIENHAARNRTYRSLPVENDFKKKKTSSPKTLSGSRAFSSSFGTISIALSCWDSSLSSSTAGMTRSNTYSPGSQSTAGQRRTRLLRKRVVFA